MTSARVSAGSRPPGSTSGKGPFRGGDKAEGPYLRAEAEADNTGVERLSLPEIRDLLDQMAEWRVLVPFDAAESARYQRLCELEDELVRAESA